ncbi:AmiS/UreI family transporter [Nocardioides sp. LHD-245]|uniref:AmiS/UreI family transporter n=1 Tax=Nocardioides sp. LHD-245 TaxID=3051387 RepID=UPI0027E1C2B8|nr:AmiS/UreI family transporter [Nocardioides sp. LHD-245]
MSSLALFFVGSVLLCNGLGLLGRLSPKDTAPINLFIGLTLVATVGVTALPVAGSSDAELSTVLGSAGFLLFAFTYLYVALNNFRDLPGQGLGWYCGWAVLVSLMLAWVNFDRFDDPKFGAIWLSWAVLFSAFFLVLAAGLDSLTVATGWLAVLQAFTTTTLPGALMLTGRWDDVPTGVVVAAQVAVVVVFVAVATIRRPVATLEVASA